VGQDKDTHALVRRADFYRAEQARRRRIAHAPKFSKDGLKPKADVAWDIFEEDPFGAAFGDDAGDLGPKVARVVGTAAFASGTEGLSGITGEDDVECAVESPGIEAAQIIPDRGRGEIPCALGGDEDSSWPVLKFHEGAGVIWHWSKTRLWHWGMCFILIRRGCPSLDNATAQCALRATNIFPTGLRPPFGRSWGSCRDRNGISVSSISTRSFRGLRSGLTINRRSFCKRSHAVL
jgi:hypothetical protein